MNIFTFEIPVDLGGVIIGGIVGLVLVLFWNWLTKPRLFFWNYKFVKEQTRLGILYKIKFKVWGFRSPGFCEFQIHWCGNMVRGNWDDLPNPLREDNLDNFEPAYVPQTFFLPVMIDQQYSIPIIHESETGELTIFSGWWFGRRLNLKYGPNPGVNDKTMLRLVLRGNSLSWEKDLTVEEIIKKSRT